jgi:hypothetical protein
MTGIALGLLVFGLINAHLWPVRAWETLRAKLSDVFRQLARLASLPDEDESPLPRMSEAYNLRVKIYQQFSVLDEMREGSKFERGGEFRQGLEALDDEARSLTLHLLAIIQQRPDLRPDKVPEPLREASHRFRTTLAGVLENLSDRVQGKAERSWPDVEAELTQMEKTFAVEIKNVADANIIAHLQGRLALYQNIVPVVRTLKHLRT